jgi:hypothetical protein
VWNGKPSAVLLDWGKGQQSLSSAISREVLWKRLVQSSKSVLATKPILTLRQEMRAQQGRKANLAKVGWQDP